MPRIRTIKPEMFESERLGRCSPLARLTFVGLIALADDEGRGRGSIVWLKGRLHAFDPKAQKNLFKATNELALARLVIFYKVGEAVYYHIPGWAENQRIQHPTPSKLPAPPHEDRATPPAVPHEDYGTPHEDDDKPHEGSRWEWNGMDQGMDQGSGKGREGSAEGRAADAAPAPTRKKREPFVPPGPEEVRAYWTEAGLRGDPDEFFDYWTSAGWRRKSGVVADWQATARHSSRRFGGGKPKPIEVTIGKDSPPGAINPDEIVLETEAEARLARGRSLAGDPREQIRREILELRRGTLKCPSEHPDFGVVCDRPATHEGAHSALRGDGMLEAWTPEAVTVAP